MPVQYERMARPVKRETPKLLKSSFLKKCIYIYIILYQLRLLFTRRIYILINQPVSINAILHQPPNFHYILAPIIPPNLLKSPGTKNHATNALEHTITISQSLKDVK
jgi:hypothetical protein